MLRSELVSKWALDVPPAERRPVWVGEFGAGFLGGLPDDHWSCKWGNAFCDGGYWKHMIAFLHEYELDWAVWALNGDRWDEAEHSWRDEWYGVLDMNYTTVRNPHMYADLQGLIAKASSMY